MRRLNLFLAFTLAAFTATAIAGSNEKTTSYKVNVAESKIEWNGKKVTGEHYGEIKLKEGLLETNGKTISSGKFAVDMNSITCADLEDQEYNQKLVNHLKSDDFFGSEKYPTADLAIKKVVKKSGDKYDVTGDLTIKGITHEITFPAVISVNEDRLTAEADIVVDRSKYNVRYGSGKFFDNLGDNLIYDDFTLKVKLVADNEAL